jgi:aminoglycoside 6'-N-acetyltransferase
LPDPVELSGDIVMLRSVAEADLPVLLEIINQPAVIQRWGSAGHYDLEKLRREFLQDEEVAVFTILLDDRIVGSIQYSEELEPDYRHAAIDIFVDPDFHRRGIATDALRTLARHLIDERGHHRVTIDPAADNAAAIACYKKVGFKPVGIMRKYERGPDGSWHDSLLMDLLIDEFR